LNNGLDRGNLPIVDWDWILSNPDHLDNTGRYEDGKPVQRIKSAE
jgi:hypothetical protein